MSHGTDNRQRRCRREVINLRFSVGYRTAAPEDFLECIVQNKDRIHEIYFSWGDFPNGRNSQLLSGELTPWQAQQRQDAELRRLSEQGLALNLLFNATCYGEHSQSRAFFNKVGQTVDYLLRHTRLVSVTTASPLIARFIRENFPQLDVRASVNMGIGTVAGMDYVAEYFTSFYLQREQNRDLAAIERLKQWCDANGKQLYLLANSGCLNHCSAHMFHDNLVAHEAQIAAMDNGYAFRGICADYLRCPDHRAALLEQTSFIRPEEVHLYEGLVPAMKLATRVHAHPTQVLRAYLAGRSRGSVLSLLEPDHTGLLYPQLLESSLLTADLRGDRLEYGNLENAMIRLEDTPCLQAK